MEAKYRLVTTWPEDSVQVRDRASNEILVEMKPHELVTMKNTFEQAQEALNTAREALVHTGFCCGDNCIDEIDQALAAMESNMALKACRDLIAANKGIRRLKAKLKKHEKR